jgi:5-methylcytosine-specific restriction endonuclease McrA
MGQVRPHLAGPTTPAGPGAPAGPTVPGGAAVPSSCGTLVPSPPPKCVPVHKNCNTTHETLLVSKMCMKLVVYSSRTRGFCDNPTRDNSVLSPKPLRLVIKR